MTQPRQSGFLVVNTICHASYLSDALSKQIQSPGEIYVQRLSGRAKHLQDGRTRSQEPPTIKEVPGARLGWSGGQWRVR